MCPSSSNRVGYDTYVIMYAILLQGDRKKTARWGEKRAQINEAENVQHLIPNSISVYLFTRFNLCNIASDRQSE